MEKDADRGKDKTSGDNNNKAANKRRGKGKGWRKALTDGETTEDAESSALSDLSDSTEDGYDENGAARSVNGERSEDYELFEKALRSKHSKACKAMSVRFRIKSTIPRDFSLIHLTCFYSESDMSINC